MNSLLNNIKNKLNWLLEKNKEIKLLKNTGLFKKIRRKKFYQLYRSMEYVKYKAGDLIIQEGDVGDALYIIIHGDVRVFTMSSQHEEIALARLTDGDYFGEQALLEETPGLRNASVKAITDLTLLKMLHENVIKILQLNEKLKAVLQAIGKEQLIKKLAEQLPLLHSVPENLLKRLAGNIQKFSDKKIIFTTGDQPDHVYFVLSGEVEIHIAETESSQEVVAKIGPEQFFGELGVLKKVPRAGTAMACGPVLALVINADIFYDLYWSTPELQELVKAMQRSYKIPQRGVVTTIKGKIADLNAVRTIYHFAGRTITAAQALGKNYFIMQEDGTTITQRIRYQKGPDLLREISLADNKIAAITCIGSWNELGYVCNLLLDNTAIKLWQIELFKKTGDLESFAPTRNINDKEEICYCMNVTYGAIKNAIRSGIADLERLSAVTGAGSVCGACRYKINELLGKAEWSMVYIDKIIPMTDKIRVYRFKFHQNKPPSYHAGQHIILNLFIDQNWVERPYTLISIPENQDYFEIAVKLETQGYFTRWLFANDSKQPLIRLSQPQGKFIMDLTLKEPAVFFAGGIGITPAVAFARSLAANHYPRRLHVDYSAYTKPELVFANELLAIANGHANFSVRLRATTKEGIITEKEIQNIIGQFPQAHFYICGHEEYELGIMGVLKSLGVSADRISTEVFVYAGG